MASTASSTLNRTVSLPSLHAGHHAVLAQARRFNWLFAGRRWRKTTLCMRIAVAGNPYRPEQRGALEGSSIVWGAPTERQARIGWLETKKACANVPEITFHETHKTVSFPGGGIIFFRTLDNPDNARGLTADGVVLDEVQDADPRAWHEVLRPMLIDTRGWFWAPGTPRGHNWVFAQHQMILQRGEEMDSMTWQIPLLGADIRAGRLVRVPHPLENPHIDFAELEQMFYDPASSERAFRQETLAEFLSDGGGVIRNVDAVACLQPLEKPVEGHEYVMGVDIGQREDYTWLTVMDATGHIVEEEAPTVLEAISGLAGRPVKTAKLVVPQVASDRFIGIDYGLIKGRIEALQSVWNCTSIVIEANAQAAFVEYLVASGLPVYGYQSTNVSKMKMIGDLSLAFEKEEIRVLDDPILKMELKAFEAQVLKGSNLVRYSAPKGMHDDGVISLALAYYACLRARIGYLPSIW